MNIAHFLMASAYAQTSAEPPLPPGGSGMPTFSMFIPMVLIFVVFYVLIIRPQNKKIDEQAKMVKALRRGDRVITSGGIHGKIVKLEGDDLLILEIAEGVQIKIVRSHVANLAAKTDPAALSAHDGDDADKKN